MICSPGCASIFVSRLCSGRRIDVGLQRPQKRDCSLKPWSRFRAAASGLPPSCGSCSRRDRTVHSARLVDRSLGHPQFLRDASAGPLLLVQFPGARSPPVPPIMGRPLRSLLIRSCVGRLRFQRGCLRHASPIAVPRPSFNLWNRKPYVTTSVLGRGLRGQFSDFCRNQYGNAWYHVRS